MVTAMTPAPRKLGEIWVTGDGCQLRVEPTAFKTASTYAGQQAVVEFAAEYALVEVLRRIVADYDRASNAVDRTTIEYARQHVQCGARIAQLNDEIAQLRATASPG